MSSARERLKKKLAGRGSATRCILPEDLAPLIDHS
jgi:hypothetical protein